jgi:hypothetical protein
MAAGAEPEVLREYRHLLRTASTDWQETAHRHALTVLGHGVRGEVLGHVRRLLLTGFRVGADDVHDVARLLVLAERRQPRTFLDGLPSELLVRLAAAVVGSPVGRMLQAGIDVWDGSEPPVPAAPEPERDLHLAWDRTDFGTAVVPADLGSTWIATPPPTRRQS